MTSDFRRIMLPYLFSHLEEDRYIVLNRLYKPIGVSSLKMVDYRKSHGIVTINKKSRTSLLAAGMFMGESSDNKMDLYFYQGEGPEELGGQGMDSYLQILNKVMNLKGIIPLSEV